MWRGGGEISCASASLCVAGSAGYLASTVKPTGRSSAWRLIPYHDSQSLDGISCPSAALCVAVDDAGGAVASTAPAAKRSAWRRFEIAWTHSLSAVSCPTPKLCVAGGSGPLFTSRHPSQGASAWKPTSAGNVDVLSCPSTSLCVGAAEGSVLVSTDPTGGGRAWHEYTVDTASYPCGNGETCPAAITGISCLPSFCLGADNLGNSVTSTDPGGGPSSWTVRPAGLASPPQFEQAPASLAVSCPSSQLCVVVSSTGEVETSTNPTGDASAWTHTDLHDPSGLNGVSCRTVSFCVAVDGAGHAFTSTNPTGGTAAWKPTSVNRGIPLNAVSCAARSRCVAVDSYGYATIGRAARR